MSGSKIVLGNAFSAEARKGVMELGELRFIDGVCEMDRLSVERYAGVMTTFYGCKVVIDKPKAAGANLASPSVAAANTKPATSPASKAK